MKPITLAGWLPHRDLSPNARVHHLVRARLVRETKRSVGYAVLAEAAGAGWTLQAQDGPRRRLTVSMRRPRLLDDDNAVGACKAVVDAVTELGYLFDDSPRHAELVVRQARVTARSKSPSGERMGTTLTLEELDG